MNSVISAFKAKKNSNSANLNDKKQQQQQVAGCSTMEQTTIPITTPKTTTGSGVIMIATSSVAGASVAPTIKKKTIITAPAPAPPIQDNNSYQYLRHLREIDTATKILSPVLMAADESNDMLHFTPAPTAANCGVDMVDNATPILMAAAPATDFNMNGATKCELIVANGNNVIATTTTTTTTNSPTQQLEQEDDESEHSAAACTSSSSEHSCSTVLHSPQPIGIMGATVSPSKSLKLSLNTTKAFSSSSLASSSASPTTSVSPSSASASTSPSPSSSTTTTTTKNNNNNNISTPASPTPSMHSLSSTTIDGNNDYVPAFLKPSPITLPIIMPNSGSVLSSMPSCLKQINTNTAGNNYYANNNTHVNSASTTPKHTRTKPHLSLSRFLNHSMPSVHGRLSLSVAGEGGTSDCMNATNGTNHPPKRMSTHQRNLSLDFRSMGILLPPVSQVTNTRINLTQHHRNRSLDSALQKIPEVEVLSPNAEQENTFCTPSILGTTMCSKIVTTAAAALATTTTTPAITNEIHTIDIVDKAVGTGADAHVDVNVQQQQLQQPQPTIKHHTITALEASTHAALRHNTNIVGVEPYPLRMRLLSNDPQANDVTTSNSSRINAQLNTTNTPATVKKREDLTSLGSDDSGIICGSESDQISLNRIRHSHESLDSGEMDADAEEECMDMLETASMDEEYGMLQSDLCFYQTMDTDCHTLRKQKYAQHPTTSKTTATATVLVQQDKNKCNNNSNNNKHKLNVNLANEMTTASTVTGDASATTTPVPVTPSTPADIKMPLVATPTTTPVQTPTTATTTKSNDMSNIETTKNEVLFKNFFGATKNAIFRTAQSIIENHEKKNAAKEAKKVEELPTDAELTASGAAVIAAGGIGTVAGIGGNMATVDVHNTTVVVEQQIKSPTDVSKKKEFFSLLTSNSSKKAAAAAAAVAAAAAAAAAAKTQFATPTELTNNGIECNNEHKNETMLQTHAHMDDLYKPDDSNQSVGNISKSSSINSLKMPGIVKCLIKEPTPMSDDTCNAQKTEKGPSGLLRFFESPVFNIHFAVHYLFYSKEPGVLSFIGNKIFSFPDHEVDIYIPQLIIMYIQMDELAEVLDPYLTIRCRKSVDFSLKCLWLLEAYNYQVDNSSAAAQRKPQLGLMKEIYSKKERKILGAGYKQEEVKPSCTTLVSNSSKKTHHRSQSDATVITADGGMLSISNRLYQKPPYTTQTLPMSSTKLCLGDLTTGRAFDNGCTCYETVRGQVNGLLGQKTVCVCGAPKTAPQKEFMKALINVGKNLTSLHSKAEKTSALRMFLNLINKNLPARVWLPLYSDIPHHVVRITEEKTAVLNSKDKTPYIIYVEVVEVHDIYSSPIIPKMMPSLRHTKSEEHLEVTIQTGNNNNNINIATNNYNYNIMHKYTNQQQQQPSTHASCSRTSSNCSSSKFSAYVVTRGNCNNNKDKMFIVGGGGGGDCCYNSSTDNNTCANTNSQSSTTTTTITTPTAASTTTTITADIAQVLSNLQLHEDDVWSQEDDEITAQYMQMRKLSERDAISQMSLESCDSRDQGMPVLFNIGDVRTRHCNNLNCENTKSFSNDPEDPSAAALKEPWHEKVQQIRDSSPYGHLSNWRLLSAIVKCGDDLRQELMATQLLQMFKIIWQEEKVDLWVRPYKIVCLSNDSGLIEPILNTVSLHQIKKNSNKSLRDYFIDEYGAPETDCFRLAQTNFVQSCAAYCLISYLLQVKDRHNGNILLHSDGHIIHIDFGFILSISPKNLGFEQSPFKLTPEFVDVMGGTSSEHWKEFNKLLLVGMMSARKHMDRIINFVEIMRSNAQLPCFKNGCATTVQNLRKRFHMNLTEQEMERKVENLVQDSLKSLSTKLYDGYQYYTNGIL